MTPVLAHGDLVVSLPLLVPPLLAVVVLGAVIWRDRRTPDDRGATADQPHVKR